MKRTLCLLAVLLTFPMMFFSAASAETRAGSISLTPMIGGYVFEGNQDIENDLIFGMGIGYAFTDRWSAEAVFGYVDTETEFTNDDVDVSLYHLDLLYHFAKLGRFEPFIAAGFGGLDLDADVGYSDNDFMINYGMGLKYFISDSFALRGDVRHIVSYSPDFDNNLAYTFGISYLFGGKAKAAPISAPPAPVAPVDTDGDGVPDNRDRCPNTPAGVPVDVNGCPKDSDGDGVYDYLDKCPDTPAGVAVDEDGCPLDTDGDKVPDYKDEGPDTPLGGVVDDRGCWIVEGLLFEFNKAVINPVSFPGLDKVAEILKKNETIKISIEGHTCNMGSESYNQLLSEKRAEAVMNYLTQAGVNKNQMTAVGYNFQHPVASNDTKEGRALNRRVELKPIDIKCNKK